MCNTSGSDLAARIFANISSSPAQFFFFSLGNLGSGNGGSPAPRLRNEAANEIRSPTLRTV